MIAIWPDSECDFWEVTNNVIIDLTGTGMSNITDECNHGYLLYANNIFMGLTYSHGVGGNGHSYFVNNLFLNSGTGASGTGWSWGWGNNGAAMGEGNNGRTRSMKLKIPGTLTTLAPNGSDKFRLEVYHRYNKLLGNIFYDSGVNVSASASDPTTLDLGFTGADYNPNNHQDTAPWAWVDVDNWGVPRGNASMTYSNPVDYNVYYKNAGKVNRQASTVRTDDEHSIVSKPNTDSNPKSTFGNYTIHADENSCVLTLTVDDSIYEVQTPMMTGKYMGKVYPYESLGVDLYAPDVDEDYFGKSRGTASTTIPGPFADLRPGVNTYTLWPIE
jgi:hypothetical protein